ncbi:MAG: ZIP family metal transporter, partial [Candidatus Omnitrophica bacterium]|nr:ZIP family metal transporter [Candidatus Omnitrophota bacterium]
THVRLSPYILAFVLSVHSIIAGIALGTEDVITKAFIILIAIVAHKGSAVFALAVNLNKEGVTGKRLRKIVTLFSFMTPVGIVCGLVLTAFLQNKAELMVEGVFDALAAGTFLYVAFIDIIEEEFVLPQDKGYKFILLTFGLGVMATLAIFL